MLPFVFVLFQRSTNVLAARVKMAVPAVTTSTISVALVPVDSRAPPVRLVGLCFYDYNVVTTMAMITV